MTGKTLLIDAGTGNLLSVYKALCHLGFNVNISSNASDIPGCRRIILPGVGAFGNFMEGLKQKKLLDALKDVVARDIPLLGICVGMQALFDISQEMGEYPGLGLLSGKVLRFPDSANLKIPQTGWNQIVFQGNHPLLKGINSGDYVYFNHSYYCNPLNPADIIARTDYGITFASMVQHSNLFGVQFHPEKSQQIGLTILSNFMQL